MEYFMLECFEYLARGARPALLLYAGVVLIRWARGKEIAFEPSMLWEFLWTWWLVTLLHATGFAGLTGGWRWSIFQPVRFGIGFYGDSLRALLLAILMFTPYGFLTPRAIKGVQWDICRIAALGGLVSFLAQMLRMSSGGYVELGGLVLSAAGAAAGYLAYNLIETLGRSCKGADAR
jgi:hypothetical protein